jgi:hypothetical protein
MKQFTIQDIRSWNPCYDPSRYLSEDWQGNALDILKHTKIPAKDKLWTILHSDQIDSKTLRLFATACARKALSLITRPDPRSLAACDVAEKFATGLATKKELKLAYKDARDATAYLAATDNEAAYAASNSAAYAAAVYTTKVQAARIAYYASDSAAEAIAYTNNTIAANVIAYTDTREWQVNKLIEMLEAI